MEQDSKSSIKIVIYGEPVPQGRPKFARIGSHVHTYDPVKSRNYKDWVRFNAIQAVKKINGFKPIENACILDVCFYRSIPASWNKKRRIEADSGVLRPVSRPDLDNYEKGFYDALNGIIWTDDSVITDKHVKKRYTAGQARVELTVTEVKPC